MDEAARVSASRYLTQTMFFVSYGTAGDWSSVPAVIGEVPHTHAGKVVASICHGPAAFVNVKVDGDYMVKGKELTSFSDSEEKSFGMDKVRPPLQLLNTIMLLSDTAATMLYDPALQTLVSFRCSLLLTARYCA